MSAPKVIAWRVLSSRITFEDRFMRLRRDRCRTAEGALIPTYHVIECADGVNVVALTRGRGSLLLIREYRHGCGEVLTGIAAGSIDESDGSAEAAARRELLEETGYGGGHFTRLLTSWANSSRQNNTVTSFLAVDVEPVATPSLDPGGAEAVETIEGDLPTVLAGLRRGELRMAVSQVTALWSATVAITSGAVSVPAALRDRLLAALAEPL